MKLVNPWHLYNKPVADYDNVKSNWGVTEILYLHKVSLAAILTNGNTNKETVQQAISLEMWKHRSKNANITNSVAFWLGFACQSMIEKERNAN